MLLEACLPYIFILNIVLALVDAAIGYHCAPILVRADATHNESLEKAARTIRAMLALVVALYSFFSCFAYYRQKPLLLLVVTGIIMADIIAQLFITNKMKNRWK